MPGFEGIIRPFVANDVSSRQGTLDLPAPVPPCRIFVGGIGKGKVVTNAYSMEITYYTIKKNKEQSTAG